MEKGIIPQCVRDYTISYRKGKSWEILLREEGNYHRHRVHKFDPLATEKIRIEVNKTNGADTARIYEVRTYNE